LISGEFVFDFRRVRVLKLQRAWTAGVLWAATISIALGATGRPVVAQPVVARISTTSPPTEQTAAEKREDLLDINTATAAQLKALPGMGDEYVRRIIAGRPYSAKNQLVGRGVLPAVAYNKIAGRIIAHRLK
jgi:competence protein ComEA